MLGSGQPKFSFPKKGLRHELRHKLWNLGPFGHLNLTFEGLHPLPSLRSLDPLDPLIQR